MSTGAGVVVVAPVVSTQATLGALQAAAATAATTVAVAALGAAAVTGLGAGMSLALLEGMRYGARRSALAADACDRAVREVRAQERLVTQVVERNARLGALAHLCRTEGAQDLAAGLPGMLGLTGQRPDEVHRWCAEVDRVLTQAESRLRDRRLQAITDRLQLRSTLPDPAQQQGRPRPRIRPRLSEGSVGSPDGSTPLGSTPLGSTPLGPGLDGPAGGPGPVLAERVRQVLDRLPAQATAQQRERVLGAARAALTAHPVEAPARIDHLVQVLQAIGDEVLRRRDEAREAAVLLQPLLSAGPGGPGDPATSGDGGAGAVREDLLAVITGTRRLDDDLRRRSLLALDDLLTRAVSEHLQTSVREELADLGHDDTLTVVEDADGRTQLQLRDRPGHELRVAVQQDPQAPGGMRVTWGTVRVGAEPDADAHADPAALTEATDRDACSQAVAALDRLTQRLARRGVEHQGTRDEAAAVPIDPRYEESVDRAERDRRNQAAQRVRARDADGRDRPAGRR
jgi:hypothetical protein